MGFDKILLISIDSSLIPFLMMNFCVVKSRFYKGFLNGPNTKISTSCLSNSLHLLKFILCSIERCFGKLLGFRPKLEMTILHILQGALCHFSLWNEVKPWIFSSISISNQFSNGTGYRFPTLFFTMLEEEPPSPPVACMSSLTFCVSLQNESRRWLHEGWCPFPQYNHSKLM